MNKHTEDSIANQIGQWALLTFLVMAALAFGGITMKLNYEFGVQIDGLAGSGRLFAVAFVATDCLMIAMPLIASTGGGWKMWQRMLFAISMALSLAAATSHLAEIITNAQNAANFSAGKAANNASDRNRVREDLARISELSTVASLQLLIPEAKGKLDAAKALAADAGIECSKRKACEKATATYTGLLERVGLAKARDELKAKLEALETAPGAAPAKTLGMGEHIARLTGGDAGGISAWVFTIVLGLILLLLESAPPALAGEAGRRIAAMTGGRRPPGKPAARPQTGKIVHHVAAPSIGRTKKDDALLRLQMMIHHAPTKELVAAYPTLAAEFGVVKSTAQKWVSEWEADGLIEVRSHGKAGSLFRAARMQRTA